MIVSMEKVRILGLRPRLGAVLEVLQDVGLLHLCGVAPRERVQPLGSDPRIERHLRHLRRAVDDVETALAGLGGAAEEGAPHAAAPRGLPGHVRRARRVRRALERLEAEAARQQDERARLLRLQHALDVFAQAPGPGPAAGWRTLVLVLTGEGGDAGRVAEVLRGWVGDDFAMRQEVLRSGETALAVSLPEARAAEVEARLADEGVGELAVPPGLATGSLAEARAALEERLEACEQALEAVRTERRALADAQGPALRRARHAIHDALRALEAREHAAGTAHLFVLEGWLPSRALPALAARLRDEEGPALVVERVGREAWSLEDAPVELRNPRIFRPFEMLTRMMPLPRYGTIDPTPFVAVFFPMFFGLMLGDVGYGAALGLLALLLHHLSGPGDRLRAVAWVAASCALFTVVFGLLYGELFGDLGHAWLGMRPLAFSREEALVPFFVLAVSIGVVHVVLGLVLGALGSLRSDPRRSLGRGLAAAMTVLVVVALLAAVQVLPARFFTPVVVALLVAYPLLVAVEGVAGGIEWISALGHVLSYARIMAIGTASVMLAVVANDLVGTAGSVVVGALFALLFHLVNFLLGVFSPTIHALRLHYVEFFGKFVSPGGMEYRPLRHWQPADESAA